jgi:hypothetical protein
MRRRLMHTRFSRSEASSSVEVNSEAKKMEMADLFQYKVCTTLPPSPLIGLIYLLTQLRWPI